MCLHSVVAVQDDRKNGIPWISRVVSINVQQKKVIQLILKQGLV